MEGTGYLASLPKEVLRSFRVGHVPHVFECLKLSAAYTPLIRAARLLRAALPDPWHCRNVGGRPQQWPSSLKVAKPEELDPPL